MNVAEFDLGLGHDAGHDLVAVEALAGGGVQGDHLTGLQLAAGHDRRGIEAEDAGLGTDVEPAALVRTPADGAQAHAIDEADEDAAIGADDAGGAIPRAEAAERPAIVREQVEGFRPPDVRLRVPDRRNGEPQGAEQAPVLLKGEVLDPFVEAARVAHLGRKEVAAGQGWIQAAGEGVDRVAGRLHRVDFAVVAREAERLRQRPVRERVGAVAAMEARDASLERGVVQVRIEVGKLGAGHEPLVADEPGRERTDVDGEAGLLEAFSEFEPLEEQPAFRRGHIALDLQQDLFDGTGADVAGLLGERVVVGGNGAEAEELNGTGRQLFAHDGASGFDSRGLGFQEEDDADGEGVFRLQVAGTFEAELLGFFLEVRLRDGNGESRAVAGFAADPAAVLHALESGERFLNDFERGFAVFRGDAADPAGIAAHFVGVEQFAAAEACQPGRYVHRCPSRGPVERFGPQLIFVPIMIADGKMLVGVRAKLAGGLRL